MFQSNRHCTPADRVDNEHTWLRFRRLSIGCSHVKLCCHVRSQPCQAFSGVH